MEYTGIHLINNFEKWGTVYIPKTMKKFYWIKQCISMLILNIFYLMQDLEFKELCLHVTNMIGQKMLLFLNNLFNICLNENKPIMLKQSTGKIFCKSTFGV